MDFDKGTKMHLLQSERIALTSQTRTGSLKLAAKILRSARSAAAKLDEAEDFDAAAQDLAAAFEDGRKALDAMERLHDALLSAKAYIEGRELEDDAGRGHPLTAAVAALTVKARAFTKAAPGSDVTELDDTLDELDRAISLISAEVSTARGRAVATSRLATSGIARNINRSADALRLIRTLPGDLVHSELTGANTPEELQGRVSAYLSRRSMQDTATEKLARREATRELIQLSEGGAR
jgi:hypothetical protein